MAYRPSAGRNQRASSGSVETNLVPIMNLFITIIPFMLLMLVISQVALVALNFTQGTGGGDEGGEGGGGDLEQAKIEIIVMASENVANKIYPGFEVREEGRDPVRIPLVNLQYDYPRLDDTLINIRERNPELFDISVSPYPDVRYEHLIKTIDLCKSHNFVNVRYEPAQVRYF